MAVYQLFTEAGKSLIDADYWYNQYNKMFFSNKLGKYPIFWRKKKNALGHVKATMGKGGWDIKEIALSNFYAMNEDQMKSVLLHEMIHVWQFETDVMNPRDMHDTTFNRKLAELDKQVPFTIMKTEDIENLQVSQDYVSNDLIVGVFRRQGVKDAGIVVFSDKLSKTPELVIDAVKKMLSGAKGWVGTIYKSSEAELYKFPRARSLNGLRPYNAPQNLVKDIEQNGEQLWVSE